MAIEQYVGEAGVQNRLLEGKRSMEKWMTSPEAITDPDDNSSAGFDCNICLDTVHDPVVTLCGHIYCWPCMYKWLQFQSNSTENQDQKPPQCPVCKAEVSDSTLVPLYGRGRTSKASKSKAPQLGIVIPKRPLGPDLGTPRTPNTPSTPQFAHQIHHNRHGYSYQRQVYDYPSSPMLSPGGTTMSVVDPVMRFVGEMVHARVSGDSATNLYSHPNTHNFAGSPSPRIRRHIMQADKSLSRLSIFIFCCLIICLLLF
ncbi:E3 ubiquitin-protein ligase RMA1H1 [Hibiscus syriacus]|uniref:E3 ubiquitin-protein ligase RMA n=1 Tax=Hibiscus syriacus TaxID=106335 RepID=A0A6A2WPM1_HIBSY|nr:E3 ubiquitin-protein ligase RMA1H1-like [Hibiscus syriacus]KAE8662308.1 E3 ubiquitin-protein ligase RMA1H1 [Hibiscus syriacus]